MSRRTAKLLLYGNVPPEDGHAAAMRLRRGVKRRMVVHQVPCEPTVQPTMRLRDTLKAKEGGVHGILSVA